MSHHTTKSRAKARSMGGFAGEIEALDLWSLSKRELIEALIRLGALAAGEGDNMVAGCERAQEEVDALRAAGII